MKTQTVTEGNTEVRQAYPHGRWTLKANPFKSSVAPAGRPTVQGELSLDKVKPLRNDLSDADLELMPRKPALPAEQPAEPVRGGAAENLFGSPVEKKPSWLARIVARLGRRKAG